MTLPAKTAVAWCAGCVQYVPIDELGPCPSVDCERRTRTRVGYICQVCEIRPIFFSAKDFTRHQGDHKNGDV
jgi:hypothetical protein